MKLNQQFGFFRSTLLLISWSIIGVTSWNYEIKLVKDIVRTEEFGVHKAGKIRTYVYSSVNTDTFEEEQRLEMCKDASKINALINRKIKFPKSAGQTGKKGCYTIPISEDDPEEVELAIAFECPSRPSMYLQLHYVNETVYVIVKEKELPAVCVVPDHYELKIVEKITDVDELQSSPFSIAFVPPIDLNECADVVRLAMCRKASNFDYELRGNEIKVQEINDIPEPAIFYTLDLKSESELVLAFKCSTEPDIYLQVFQNRPLTTLTVATIIQRKDLLFSS